MFGVGSFVKAVLDEAGAVVVGYAATDEGPGHEAKA